MRKALKKVIKKATSKKVDRKIVKPIIEKKVIPIETKIPEPIIQAVTEPIVSTPEIQTLTSDSMLNDLMGETDKDNQPENTNPDSNTNDDLFDDIRTEEKNNTSQTSTPSTDGAETIGDKIHETLTTDGEDWQNPSDFRKMCAVNAMMYVEGGAILLSFIGQMISGDWTPEGEKRYYPSEERRKIIRAPLAKKFELNKDHSKSTPTGALITAIIFTVLPIVIIAFKDRKARKETEAKNLENLRLKKELEASQFEIERLRANGNITNTVSNTQRPVSQNITPFLVKKRGRHKADCDCEKCNLKKMKTGKRK